MDDADAAFSVSLEDNECTVFILIERYNNNF